MEDCIDYGNESIEFQLVKYCMMVLGHEGYAAKHRVYAGETLVLLARKYGRDNQDLRDAKTVLAEIAIGKHPPEAPDADVEARLTAARIVLL